MARWFLFSGERGLDLEESIFESIKVLNMHLMKNKQIFFTKSGKKLGLKNIEKSLEFAKGLADDLGIKIPKIKIIEKKN